MSTFNRVQPVSVTRIAGIWVAANGIEQPRIWDGVEGGSHWVLGAPGPTSAPTTAEKGAGVLNGTYYYKYTWYRSAGADIPEYESHASPISAAEACTDKEITVTYVNCSTTLGWTHVRIYRMSTAQPTYYRVATVAAGSTTYDDNNTDASIVGNATLNEDKYGTTLPIFRYVLSHRGRLIGARPRGYEDRVYIGQAYPYFEDFLTNNWFAAPEWITGLGAIFEDVYVFTNNAIQRARGIEDPTSFDVITLVEGLGSLSPVISYKNSLFFMDQGVGPCALLAGGNIEENLGAKLHDFWREEVNKDMLPFLPIVASEARNVVNFYVATGTRPYATHRMEFDVITNQWSVRPLAGVCAGGVVENQYGKRKVLVGMITGDIFQHGEDTDTSDGAYDGTLSGTPTAVAGETFTDGTAAFDATVVGCPILFLDTSGDVAYRGVVVTRVSATQLRIFPQLPTAVTTSYSYLLGGIEAYWTSKEDDCDAPDSEKLLRWIDITYELQTAGVLEVHYQLNGGSWVSAGTVDMTTEGSARLPGYGRFYHIRVRVRQYLPGRPWQVTNIAVEGTVAR